ncbi:hypothetical protein [Sinanaerobacter chloroacetimidivorans]|uniref:Uncharacterized protein n=1 Tax=Sinanaerobacter chloroacetimidivorans TaxID=2818044 RepID=A0A8J8B272_9FIRM|nr:hypothetical protein [Sinanaerobacter chloroacetimidivorans]MBR0598466.1 hypothetical protein [Sinanaerobacter chloroacetimidivorans]
MNKKRLKTIAATAVAGCLLLTMSVTAFAASGSGYESYKNAVESTILAQNATVDAQFEVKDNGSVILSGNSNVKLDNENSSSKTTLTADGVTKTFATSKDESTGAFIRSVDDQYYVMQKDNEKQNADQKENDKLTASSSTVKLAEMLADTLAGDVKNQFVKNGQTVSLNLEGSQIPELAKLAVSAAAENNGRIEKEHNGDSADQASLKTLMDRIPKLSNTDVKSVSMTATVDGNLLKNNVATVVITGTDASGSTHELSIMIKGDISNVGNTKIDTIDTTGKNVTTISRNEHHED